jgi:Actin like proteins N terminal domain/StbA protein
MTKTTTSVDAIYYAGYDPGSGIASLKLIPADAVELAQDLFTLPSAIADGNLADLLDRGDIDATVQQVLRPGEYALTLQDADYFLGTLTLQGKNNTAALAADLRYWSIHSRVLLLTLAAHLIPEKRVELRIVTALPVSLYTKENRRKVRDALSGYYRYDFNGRTDLEAYVKVGYVATEGQGALVHCGKTSGKQGVIDIGERTTDLVGANGQVLNGAWCAGEPIGIGQLADDLKQFTRKRYQRIMSTDLAHDLLKAFIHDKSLSRVTVDQTEEIPEAELREVIGKSIKRLSRTLSTLVSSTWTTDGGGTASDFDEVFLAGGGAYYFEQTVRELIRHVTFVPDPQDANVRGYAELAIGLEDMKPEIWELD